MTKIEEIEQLRTEWRERSFNAEARNNEQVAAEAHNIAYGLTLALRIIKKENK